MQRANDNIYDLIVQITVLHTSSSTVWDICEVCRQVVRFCYRTLNQWKFWRQVVAQSQCHTGKDGCYMGGCIKGIVQWNYFIWQFTVLLYLHSFTDTSVFTQSNYSVVRKHKPTYMFQQYITVLRKTSIKKEYIILIHKFHLHNFKNM